MFSFKQRILLPLTTDSSTKLRKKMKKTILLLSLITVLVFGCKKEEIVENPKTQPTANNISKITPSERMLVFRDINELIQTLGTISAYDYAEQVTYETNIDFVSFGRANDELYYSIDETTFSDFTSVENFVKAYPEALKLVDDGNGEYYLETVLSKQPLKYLINKDQMLQVGNEVFLVLENGIISSLNSNLNLLKQVNEDNYLSFCNKPGFNFIPVATQQSDEGSRDLTYNVGTSKEERITDGRDRTVLSVVMCSFQTYEYPNGTNQWVYYEVKPYHKSLGIWFGCKRHISCSIKVAADYFVRTSPNTGNWVRRNGNYSCSNKYTTKVSGTLCSEWISIGFNCNPDGHFGGYNCWGDTPSTNPNVVIQANTFLCP